MEKTEHHPETEILEAHQCWEQLRGVSLGHLAVSHGDQPRIFPINFTVDHGTVVFRTGPGNKLDVMRLQPNVAFEADGVDQETGIAWSVMVEGTAELFQGIEDVIDSFSLMLFPWEPGPKDQFVRIVPASVTGRRFRVADPGVWWKNMKHG